MIRPQVALSSTHPKKTSAAPKRISINKIAAETSSDLVKQLIGIEVNNSSISAIVEDISKKVREKNYEI